MTSRRIPGKKPRIISNPSSIAEIRDPKSFLQPKDPNRRPNSFRKEFSILTNLDNLKISLGNIFDGSKFFPSSKTYRPKKK